MKRPDVLNRLLLGLLGIALFFVAAYGLARSYNAFGNSEGPFLPENVRAFVGRNHDWFWPCALVVALAAAYLGCLILRAQFAYGTTRPAMHNSEGKDEIVVSPSVVGEAIAEDLELDPMITNARARLTNMNDTPQIDLDVTVPDGVTLAELRQRIQTETVERARAAIESGRVQTRVVVNLAETGGHRLR
jgi:hypothetical protein